MKKIMLVAVVVAAFSGIAAAADNAPALLCNIPNPVPAKTAACEPPPPVCAPPPPVCPPPAPAPVCPPPPPVCQPEPTVCAAPAPAAKPMTVTQYRVVPVKRKVWEEETYTVNETRTQEHEEIRTKVIKPPSPRLARVVRNGDVALVVHKREPRIVPYTQKIKTQYTVPVERTRKVAREYEEYKVVEQKRRVR